MSAQDIFGFSTSMGPFVCYFTPIPGQDPPQGKPSMDLYDPSFGFPPNVYCRPQGWPPKALSCAQVVGITFSDNERFGGQKVFPRASPEGFKVQGDVGAGPTSEFVFSLVEGFQNGFETYLTGGATAEELGNKQMLVSVSPYMDYLTAVQYETDTWIPGLAMVKNKKTDIKISNPVLNGGAGVAKSTMEGSQRFQEVEYVEFCGLNGAGSKPAEKPAASSGGDPHFKTWSGQKFDFHGGCDLVLLQNDGFNHGLGLDIHIRTKIEGSWSYIETAAIRMGDHILEIAGGLTEIPYWLDGTKTANLETGDATLGDYAIHFRRINDHQSQTRLDLGNGNALSIETFKRFVRVNVKTNTPESFAGTYGMLGSFPEGEKVGRDTTTIIEDANEFGQEWQVLATEAKLFHQESDVQPPMRCVMPDATRKSQSRRLGEATVSEEDAALACARVSEEDRDACIFDVMATDDKDMAGSY